MGFSKEGILIRKTRRYKSVGISEDVLDTDTVSMVGMVQTPFNVMMSPYTDIILSCSPSPNSYDDFS